MLETFTKVNFVVSGKWHWCDSLIFVVKNKLASCFDPSIPDNKVCIQYLLKCERPEISLILSDLLRIKDQCFDAGAHLKSIKLFKFENLVNLLHGSQVLACVWWDHAKFIVIENFVVYIILSALESCDLVRVKKALVDLLRNWEDWAINVEKLTGLLPFC